MRNENEIRNELEKAKQHFAKTYDENRDVAKFWEGYKAGLEWALGQIA